MNTLRYSNGTSDLLKLQYGYTTTSTSHDNNGQIRSIDDLTTGTVNDVTSLAYTYDAWSRLKIAQTKSLSIPPPSGMPDTWKLEWVYDRLGNRLSQSLTGGSASITAPTLTISETTNRITDSSYSYDAAGNMTNDSVHRYAYDAENRIKSVDSTGTYVYDGNGLRIQKDSTTYIYSGSKVIAEYTSSGLDKEYVYSGSQLLTTFDASGNATYSHPDHLSTRVETDASGNVTRSSGHFPFGETWYEPTGTNKLKFTTYERDSSGLDYALMRYNSPRLGRFMTTDLLSGSMQNPQSLNRYSYVGNDPVNLVDPLGLLWALWCYPQTTEQEIAGVQLCGFYWVPDGSDQCGVLGCDQDGGHGDNRGGGAGGNLSVSNAHRDPMLDKAFKDLLDKLAKDADCLKFLASTGGNPLGYGADLLRFGALGVGEFSDNGVAAITGAAPGAEGFAISVNSKGGFYDPKYVIGPRELQGGSEKAQRAILIHELGHAVVGPGGKSVLRPDHTGVPKDDAKATKANDKDVDKNCSKTINGK